ncbi:MAG: MFS transporter [Bacteroidota bacterium]|nr:MFS transporter [Bacteroidota bacterium]
MEQTSKASKRNFYSFLWHAGFLAFATNFMDVDTIIPAMLVEAGGSAIHVGLLTAIMLGGSSFTQLLFAPFLNNRKYKKGFLLLGINSRVISLLSLGALLYYLSAHQSASILWFIFIFITIFSLGGAFANISYIDILGKTINQKSRKKFFSSKQILSGTVVLFSAMLARKVLKIEDFPINYAYMFFIGGLALLISSAGFWNLHEDIPSGQKIKGMRNFFGIMKQELVSNKKLVYFLGFINTQGIAVTLLPFVILYAKQLFKTGAADTGMFLLFKIIGVVLVSIMVLISAKITRYKYLLYLNVGLSLLLAILTISISDAVSLRYIFVIGGIVYSLYSISMNGVMLEISGHSNRALYAGFSGAGNIMPMLFPLLGGFIIEQFGFQSFFVLYMIIVSMALFFIFKIDCKK